MNMINFDSLKRVLFNSIAIFSLFLLQSCNDDMQLDKANNDIEENKVELYFNIDNTYEFDDNETRAAQFSAEDAPRVVLTDEEFTVSSDANTNSTKNGYDYTAMRINIMNYNNSNTISRTVVGNLFKNENNQFSIKNDRNKTTVKVLFKYGNLNLPMTGTWFGQMIIGGFPGKNDKLAQFFSTYRPINNKNGFEAYINASPNHRIDELDPHNASMSRRHFPLVGDIMPMNNYWSKPGVQGNTYSGNNNTGQFGINEYMEVKLRGSIFSFTLDNRTGKDIEVTHIEVPVQGTRGDAFSFEGKFASSNLKPFKDGVLNKEGCIPVFEKQDYKKLRQDIDTYNLPQGIEKPEASPESFRFPLYRIGGQANIPLSIGQQSRGRFMVWAYAHQPELGRPFTVRVRYTSNGQEYISKAQIVTPPDGGFKEGKAYRSLLKIEL